MSDAHAFFDADHVDFEWSFIFRLPTLSVIKLNFINTLREDSSPEDVFEQEVGRFWGTFSLHLVADAPPYTFTGSRIWSAREQATGISYPSKYYSIFSQQDYHDPPTRAEVEREKHLVRRQYVEFVMRNELGNVLKLPRLDELWVSWRHGRITLRIFSWKVFLRKCKQTDGLAGKCVYG